MPQTNSATPGLNQVARLATSSVSIDLNGLVLLGTFGSQERPRALVRRPDGGTQRLAPGDSVAGRQVQAIGHGRIILSIAGRNETLVLPGENTATSRAGHRGSR